MLFVAIKYFLSIRRPKVTGIVENVDEIYTTENGHHRGVDLQDLIWHLNDGGFTYKQIVKFLETTFLVEKEE